MKKWIACLTVALLLILSGCQTLDGINMNQAMKNSLTATSGESTRTIAITLLPDDKVELSGETKKWADLLGAFKLTLSEVKTQDMQHMSFKGELAFAKGNIPFMVNASGTDIMIQTEGSKKPIVIRYAGDKAKGEQLSGQLTNFSNQLMVSLAQNMPNPSRFITKSVNLPIHDEMLTLKNVHAELNGAELTTWVKGLLANLSDDDSTKSLIGQLYDIFAGSQDSNLLSDALGIDVPFLDNKSFVVGLVMGFLNSKNTVDEFLSTDKGKKVSPLLNNKQSLAADIYIDSNNLIRKSAYELKLELPPEEWEGLAGVKVTMNSEMWNINKPVEMEKVDLFKTGIAEFTGAINPSKLLASFDPKSLAYKVLKEDFRITNKDIRLVMDNSGRNAAAPYNKNGTVFVPARFVSEQLDADVDWDEATKQVKINDELRGVKIIMTIGNQTASVNGVFKKLESAPELTNGLTFVPVRFIAEQLGGIVGWDQDTGTVVIVRD
ncbi:copper amine oxidase N-terminal domain-containing protein [Paenibacillus thalictri]|uniref:Copper amine oxidase N-terminal domain-containing protein n=1 Tax=Paenibacillus thalictri TaxID=2527873 RepID=A0A4Q9DKX2_9BACL|nr:copper amine oxidase N-terminal domain-containing protein [Paenibacillus thalictri]TBL71531.1 copper amine oxidase N-terminal domain-containing protein [Paenibacillus thalictri]